MEGCGAGLGKKTSLGTLSQRGPSDPPRLDVRDEEHGPGAPGPQDTNRRKTMQLNRRQFLGSAAAAAAFSTAPAVMTAVVQKDQGHDQN